MLKGKREKGVDKMKKKSSADKFGQQSVRFQSNQLNLNYKNKVTETLNNTKENKNNERKS